MRIYDISMTIEDKMIVYPGNPKTRIRKYAKKPKASSNSSIIQVGSHTGTHVDAKSHILLKGQNADQISLDTFYGPCWVLDLTKIGKEIKEKHLKKNNIKKGEIILLKTENSFLGYKKFRKNFTHIKIDAAKYLIKKRLKHWGLIT